MPFILDPSRLADLAFAMGLLPDEARALPATIEVASRKAGLPASRLVEECLHNEALREYLANAARKGAAAI